MRSSSLQPTGAAALLLATLLLGACSQNVSPTAPVATTTPVTATTPDTAPALSKSLGRVEVTFSGVGTQVFATSVRDLSSTLSAQQVASPFTRQPSGLQVRFNSKGTFDVGVAGSGTRYLYATYDVRNASADGVTPSATARSNLTFVAVDATTPNTIPGTAVRNLKRFDGTDANPALANDITPLHGMMSAGGVPTVNASLADFMAFTENEAGSLGTLSGVRSVLPYGFVVRNKATGTSRTLAANPVATQYDGQVTFAVELPLQATATDDPYTFSLVFEVVQDSATRVTKTAEESFQSAKDRATILNAAQVNAESVCRVRVAGTVAAPTRTLSGLGAYFTAPGSLDKCFGTGGKVITTDSVTSTDEQINAVKLQADGKIVVAGFIGNDTALARYNTDGTLDTTFGIGGKVITDVSGTGNRDEARSLQLQPDGRIVVAGTAQDTTGSYDFAVARYTSAGVLDTTFGTGGKVITPVGRGFNPGNLSSGISPSTSADTISAVQVLADGKIVVAGTASNARAGANTDSDFALARYTAAGVLDPTFGTGGLVTTDINTNSNDRASALQLQPDGRLVVAGTADDRAGGDNFAVARYTAAGALDPSFGAGGKVTTDINTTDDTATAMQVQPDGKIVVAGTTNNASSALDFALLRYTTTGALDPSFGTSGKVITAVGAGSSNDRANAMQLQPDGKIMVAGSANNATGGQGFALVRYTSDGALDNSTISFSKVITAVGTSGSNDQAYALQVQPDGKIVVAGSTTDGGTAPDFALIRIISTTLYD